MKFEVASRFLLAVSATGRGESAIEAGLVDPAKTLARRENTL
jgi:hypothetical protein